MLDTHTFSILTLTVQEVRQHPPT